MKLIFEKKNHKYKFGHDFKNVLEPLVTSLPENELLLSFAGKSHIDNKIIFDAFDFFLNGIEIHQAKDNYSRRQDSIKRLDENEEIKKKYIDFMKSIDETFENCDIIWISNENKYYVRNKYRGFDKSIDIEEESSGIQNLFDSMSTIFSILDEGKIFICDEWERTFHPLIIKELIKKFLYNKKSNAQIIITTHCTDLLDNTLLRNDQIWFTNLKTENRETELYALSDFKGIESFDDIRNDYLAGRYGAIPLLDEMTKEEN
jgi:AAA15 family ATPase/GTPase